MNRSGLAAVSLHEKLKTLNKDYNCLLTEPFRFKSRIASLPQKSYLIPSPLSVDNNRAIIVSNLELIEISNLCTEDSAVAILKGKSSSILIVSSYQIRSAQLVQIAVKLISYEPKNWQIDPYWFWPVQQKLNWKRKNKIIVESDLI